jgi:hypothetical protein
MSEASPSRSRKRFRWVRWALGVCCVLAAAAWLATPWYVRAKVLNGEFPRGFDLL